MTLYTETKLLPETVRRALENAGHHKADIEISQATEFRAPGAYGTGSRGYVAVVNLATGESQESFGSWGGANPFQTLPVDEPDGKAPLAPGFVAIVGNVGYRSFFELIVHPENFAKVLPPADESVTPRERWILGVFKSLTSKGRKDEFGRHGTPSAAEFDSLVARGFLTRNKAGAMALTTAGKNAAGRYENFVAPSRAPEEF